MFYDTIGIALTQNCPIRCDMCLLECGPEVHESIDEDVCLDLIDQINDIPYINHFVLSGGEPFVDFEKLVRIIDYAKKLKLKISCNTNAFWCKSDDETYRKLNILKKAGLNNLITSIDVFHQQYISPKKVKRLLDCTFDLKMDAQVTVGILDDNIGETYKLLSELGASICNQNIVIAPFLPIGFAINNLKETDYCRNIHKSRLQCPGNSTLFISTSGKVYPCCLLPHIDSHNINLGNIYSDKLTQILHNAETNKFTSLVMLKGLNWMVEKIDESDLIRLDDYYVNGCHFCNEIHRSNEYEKIKFLLEGAYNEAAITALARIRDKRTVR